MSSKKELLYYYHARQFVCERGYYPEIFCQDVISSLKINEEHFFREYAWVVLSSGLSERVVISVFRKLSPIFFNWSSPASVVAEKVATLENSLLIFNSPLKITAIIEMASYLLQSTMEDELKKLDRFGIDYLRKFKFLGPATVYHFAKNIGLNFAKPDRHLVRIARYFGTSNVHDFCDRIAESVAEKRSVVDIVLWRYATLNKHYIKKVKCG